MQIIEEEFWKKIPLPSMFIITTNGVIGDNQELVMGTGIAREATKKIKGIAKICGEKILEKGKPVINAHYNYKYVYHFLPVLENEGKNYFGIFQIKIDWKNIASLELVEESSKVLSNYINNHPEINYRMNYPAIGAGRLLRRDVEPILINYFENKNITFCTRKTR